MLLKQVNFFSDFPDAVLEDIASILEEVIFEKGDTVIKKDEAGESMYIVVSGNVRVHDNGQTLAVLKGNSIFGELSLLSAEPRASSITCESFTRALRLEQKDLYRLMESQDNLGVGIIRALVHRIRLCLNS